MDIMEREDKYTCCECNYSANTVLSINYHLTNSRHSYRYYHDIAKKIPIIIFPYGPSEPKDEYRKFLGWKNVRGIQKPIFSEGKRRP